LHRQLDVTFREDDHRFQRSQGVENPELMRRLALVLLKAHPAKMSMAMKRDAASLDIDFLEEIFSGDGILEKR